MSGVQFKIILSAYLLLVIASFLVPEREVNGQDRITGIFYWLSKISKLYRYSFVILAGSVVIAGVVGFIGMFLLLPWAPYVFFISVAIRVMGDYFIFQEASKKGMDSILSKGTLLTEMVIASLIFIGPANELFTL